MAGWLRWRRNARRVAQRALFLILGGVGWALAQTERGISCPPLRPGTFQPRRILLIRLDLIGDLVHSTPAIRALRRTYPEAELHLLALPVVADVLAGDPDLDRVLTYDPHAWMRPWGLFHGEVYRAALALVRALRAYHYDLCVSICGDWASIVARVSGARRRVGYQGEAYSYFLTDPIPGRRYELRQHEVAYVLALARAAGATVEPADYLPRLTVNPSAAAAIGALLAARGVDVARMLVVFHVGATNGWAKRWPVEYWAELGDRLVVEWGAQIVLTGAACDQLLTHAVHAGMREPVIDLAGETTLPQLVALLARARLVISGDSGPAHIAGAVGTPVVAMYGPTDPAMSGPVGSPAVVLRRDLWCSPCYDPRASAECRYLNPICMWGIRPDQVFEAARHLLERVDCQPAR